MRGGREEKGGGGGKAWRVEGREGVGWCRLEGGEEKRRRYR